MMKPLLFRLFRCTVLFALAGFALSGCASLHPSANGPGDCMGPPDFCVPYFGS
ncbi:hypothetical protein [Paraburkholderia phosphatilytica]|jgi:hypothetical protein|uniref:hypothetical protein n=1 Tax=Paraburkholderia phosphatilytica TaxID=2282883 RepID=UPI0013DEE375|nr:hypothetical protein [Paraburkholderia phosphatilytica]